MPSAFDWNCELSWIKEYRFPLDQGMQTVYECLENWMDDYNRNVMITTFMTSEEKEQIIAVCVFNAQATSANCISQICRVDGHYF